MCREDNEEDVSSYWITLRKVEDTCKGCQILEENI
jgi:hypothetical protein